MTANLLFKNIFIFILLVMFQVLVLNNIQISNLGITPYMYVLFIVLLPFETQSWLTLIFAFVLGFIIDIFEDTPGVHASATLVMAFSRPLVLNILQPRDGYEAGTLPRIKFMGFYWFVKYTVMLIFVHHFVYSILDIFTFRNFHLTLLEIIITTAFSSILVILSQYFIFRKN